MPPRSRRHRKAFVQSAPRARGAQQTTELSTAVRYHKAGDLRTAERLYRSVLNRNPGNSEALHLLGVIAMQTGRPTDGVGLIGRAIQVNGAKAEYHYNLGMAYLGLRSRDEAIKCFRQAISLRPNYADALINLGNLLLNAGAADEAETHYRKAAQLVPSSPMIHNNLGTALLARDAAAEAVPYFREALRLKPDFAEAHNGLGLALYATRKFDDAVESFRAALRYNPNYAQAYNNLGNVYFEEDRLEDAETCLRKAIELKPDYVQARRKLGRVYLELDDFAPALEIYENLLAVDPASKEAWGGKVAVLDRMGRTEEAHEIVRSFAAEGPPPLGMVHQYANIASKERRQAEVAAEVEGMLAQARERDEHRPMLHFTLGRLYDELARYDEAFRHYEAGNQLREAPFDPKETVDSFDRIIKFFSAETLATLPRANNRSELLVFIVGMPRSGTSLVEQILSCHPDVHAAGELRDIGKLSRELGFAFYLTDDGAADPRRDSEPLNSAADRHLEKLRGHGGNARRVTDKMPYNFLNLGLITLLFPRARLIHCVRDPLDTCLSCYFQNFSTGNFFSFDLGHAGLYYRQYQRLMAHWGRVLDRPMLDVRYEEHVAEPEKVCREILAFLELDWDPACLRFYESHRYMKTASKDQVRKPIYRSSAGRWRNYAAYLDRLKEALSGPAPRD